MTGREYGENERHHLTFSHKLSHLRRKLLIVPFLHIYVLTKLNTIFSKIKLLSHIYMYIYIKSRYRFPEEFHT